ncbi:MAG: WD40/YVTN/BNR-like repeat-containing protein [Bacteroidota bacterium]
MNIATRATAVLFTLLVGFAAASSQLWLPNIQQRAIFSITTNPLNPRTLYAGGYGRALYASTDGGATWLELSVGELGGISQVSAVVINPGDTNVILAGGVNFSGVDRSTDGGISWRNVLNDPEARRFEVNSRGSIDFHPSNPDTV